MATIMICWELGGGYGHLRRIKPYADALTGQGHRVVWAAKRLDHLKQFLMEENKGFGKKKDHFEVVQLPFPQHEEQKKGASKSYGDILLSLGYADAGGIKKALTVWDEAIEKIKPDLLMSELSPITLLSGHIYNIPVVDIGSGWALPSNTRPMGLLLSKSKFELLPENQQREIKKPDNLVLKAINSQLKARHKHKLKNIHDLYDLVALRLLHTFPELDAFGPREVKHYVGIDKSKGKTIKRRKPQHVLVYISEFDGVVHLLEIMQSLPYQFTVYMSYPRLDKKLIKAYRSRKISFHKGELNFESAATQCDAFLSNGSHGTCLMALLAGLPVVVLPTTQEKRLVGKRAQEMGAGILNPLESIDQIKTNLQRIVEEPAYTEAARAFADKYKDFDYEARFEESIDKITALLK